MQGIKEGIKKTKHLAQVKEKEIKSSLKLLKNQPNPTNQEEKEVKFSNNNSPTNSVSVINEGVLENEKDKENVEKYEGGLKDGKLTGEYYEGQWANGKKHGFGTKLFATHERYQGEWKDDVMSGVGNLLFPKEEGSFTGEWDAGKRVAGEYHCRKIGKNKQQIITYKKIWTDDTPGPSGEIQFADGAKYIGEVLCTVQGKYTIRYYTIFRHGYGEMLFTDKSKYIGHWKNDKRKGYGVYIHANGEKYYGNWTKSMKTGFGVHIFLDGSYYEGSFLHNERKGKGKLCLPNGDLITGDWHQTKIINATHTTRKFTDFPRSMRSIYLYNVTAIQRTEDTSLCTTKEKWTDFVREALLDMNCESQDVLGQIGISLLDETQMLRNVETEQRLGVSQLAIVVVRFIHVFNWEYEKIKVSSKKEALFALQTAVDDVNSFLECLSDSVKEKLNLNYKQYKSLVDVLIRAVFPKVYAVLFPLYRQVAPPKKESPSIPNGDRRLRKTKHNKNSGRET